MICCTYNRFLLVLMVIAGLLTGCVSTWAQPLPYVNLRERTPLPEVSLRPLKPLRLGVAAIVSPEGTADSYDELARYLGEKLGQEVELVQRRTYAEINEMVGNAQVDLAFVCTNAYVIGRQAMAMDLLVTPEIDGKSVYHARLIVPADSPAQNLAALRGKTFAFTDPMSFSGRIYPLHQLQQLNEMPESFFARTFYTYSHDRAIEAVAEGVADGASVDSLVLAHAMKRDPTLAQQIRVIHTSQAFGVPPVVTPHTLPLRQRALLASLLMTMHEDPAGQEVLRHLGVDRFVSSSDTAYDGVRRIVQAVKKSP